VDFDYEAYMAAFPHVTTLILDEHNDEVWSLSWNHAGTHLATGGSDKRAIVWRIGVSSLLSVICEQRLTEPTQARDGLDNTRMFRPMGLF
jgi:WD40 repeat protein